MFGTAVKIPPTCNWSGTIITSPDGSSFTFSTASVSPLVFLLVKPRLSIYSAVTEIFFPTSDNSYSTNEVDNHEDENSHKRQPPSEDDLIGTFFKLLKFCPTDHRVNAIQNVLLCGGLASIPGFGFRFLQELKQVIAYFPTRYNMYKTCVDNLHITNTKVPTISIAWTGASILGSFGIS